MSNKRLGLIRITDHMLESLLGMTPGSIQHVWFEHRDRILHIKHDCEKAGCFDLAEGQTSLESDGDLFNLINEAAKERLKFIELKEWGNKHE